MGYEIQKPGHLKSRQMALSVVRRHLDNCSKQCQHLIQFHFTHKIDTADKSHWAIDPHQIVQFLNGPILNLLCSLASEYRTKVIAT